jgi:PAS domain S-box-containing protein
MSVPADPACPFPFDDTCKAILEVVTDGVWVTDCTDRLICFNPAMERLAGVNAVEMLGLSVVEDFPPETTARFLEYYLRAKQDRVRVQYEADVVTPAGRQTIQAGWLTPRYSGDTFEGMICTVQDVTEQRTAEASLLATQVKLEAALESMTDALFICDIEGQLVEMNEAWAAFGRFGSTDESPRNFDEYPGLFEAFWPDGRPADVKDWATPRALRGETRTNEEYLIRRKDTGETFLGSYSFAPVMGQDGGIVGAVVVARDVTEARRAENALVESEGRLKNLVRTAPVAIVILGPDGRLIQTNPVADELLGLEENEGVGKTLADPKWRFLREDGTSMPVEEYPASRVISTGAELRESVLGVERGGPDDLRWVLVNAIPRKAKDGSIIEILATFMDITERMDVEEALRTSEERFRSLFEQMLDAFAIHEIICDDQGKPVDYRFLSVNPAFETMTGLRAEDVTGRTVLEILPETEPRWIDTYGQVALTGDPVVFEDYHQELDRYFYVTAFRPAPKQFACIFIDVTERKRTEETLRESDEHLRQAQRMEAVGQLAGGIAHDFNNLLAAILGYAHLLLADPALADPALRSDLEEIRHAAERAAALTQQILAFSRRQTLRPAVVSLNEVIAGMGPLFRGTLDEDIDLVFELDPSLRNVETDVHQFERVIMNLVLNARDAMLSGGRITVATRNQSLDRAFCRTHPGAAPGEYVELSVADTGEGMDEDTQKHVFEPFFTTKAAGEGSGLGLSVAYGIVKQSQGAIYVESHPGEGTRFSIYLPARESPETVTAAPIPGLAIPIGTETILVVEDETAVCMLVARVLSDAGYAVLTAESAAQALQLVDSHQGPLHLLLTDVVLPRGLQGPDLARELTARRPGLPVLFMSGYPRDAMVNAGRLDEGVRLVEKPFSPEAITRAVREAIDEARGR